MMVQGVPDLYGNSGDGGVPPQPPQPAAQVHRSGGGGGGELGGGFSEVQRGRIEEGDRSSGGNRWPRQETLALLKIRSDMDVAFRDSSFKGPLWDEVSRKLAELGYHRSAKKCREKFENVFKYHKRTKDGRTSKSDGKTYRFFDQLEALEANPTAAAGHPPQVTAAMLNQATSTVPSAIAAGSHQNNANPISVAAPATVPMPTMNHTSDYPFSYMSVSSDSTSSSTFSDEEAPEKRRKRKRKWKDLFGRMMKEVIDKQEELQMKFLETLERRDRERAARDEAWRMEEMAKINQEHQLLAQERSVAAAKDAAVIAFLQKIAEQNPNAAAAAAVPVLRQQPNPQTPPPPPPPPQPIKQPNPQPPPPPECSLPAPALPPPAVVENGGGNMLSPSPSRWPKAEITALINLRTTLDTKYQENGPKGPFWEEISAGMKKLGYNRNAKRCKEKWENINKYYKKVKESSKRRPEDSKTCPYFNQLDAIYREKANNPVRPETQMAPIMAQPERQWPIPAMVQVQQQQQRSTRMDQNNDDDYDDYDEDDDDDDDDEGEEDEGGEYEIVPNKASSMAAAE